MNRFPWETGDLVQLVRVAGLAAFVGLAGCAAGDPAPTSLGAPKSAGPTGSSSGAQQSSGDDSCTSCSNSSSGSPSGSGSGGGSGGGGGSTGSDDSSVASEDATTPGDDGSTAMGDSGAPPFTFPPITLPDSGTSTSADGGPNSCNTKICIDPVFDCPLQGCFNGCVNFICQ